jgi:hypothetical protein
VKVHGITIEDFYHVTYVKNEDRVCNKTFSDGKLVYWVTRWRSWLRHCATNWKVAGSIPDGVTGISHRLNPSGRVVALESTQPLT